MALREEYYLVADRTISGKGLIKIPPSDAYRAFSLYVNVVRLPRNNSLSSKFNPDRSDYGKLTWMRNDYVMREQTVNYESQLFNWDVDITGYIASYLACAFDQINDYLGYLAPFIPAPPLIIDPVDRLHVEPLRNTPDSIRIVCRADAAVVVKLYALKYDVGCLSASPSPKVPPDPSPVSQVPPGTSIGVSPPYSEPNDDGNTIPLSTDPIDVLPSAQVRVSYRVDPGYSNSTIGYNVDVTFTVPNNTYTVVLRDGPTPAPCAGHTIPETTWAESPSYDDVLLDTHNTCNLLSITGQVFV